MGSGWRSTLVAEKAPDISALAAAALTGLSQRRSAIGLVGPVGLPVTSSSPASVVPPLARLTDDSLAWRAAGSADRIRTAAARSVPVMMSALHGVAAFGIVQRDTDVGDGQRGQGVGRGEVAM